MGEVIGRLERKGLRLVAAELQTITREKAAAHYAEHVGKPFYDNLMAFITRSPAMVMVIEGPDDAHAVVRSLMGVTDPSEALPGTIRGDLALKMSENLVHGSDSAETAAREIGIFFPDLAPAG